MSCCIIVTSSDMYFLNQKIFVAMHFIDYINRLIATKVDLTYLGY